ncbi:MAG: site-specific DNA-methyltransferase [Gemmatales bacterium]|nr:site-specific DNA-methyltransferase [Gemmatales bacterium]MDW8175643.1 site-specific DNA-methyltransferase [Gemmatales bacterium]
MAWHYRVGIQNENAVPECQTRIIRGGVPQSIETGGIEVLPGYTPAYQTELGAAYVGDSLELMKHLANEAVALVVTSPPFPLRRRKSYGNADPERYLDWFMPFAEEIWRVLAPDGSFVLEMSGAWNRGQPTRSLLPYRLVLRLADRFCLAQECYWYNPSRLPTPAEWVTVRRNRLKDAVHFVWWFSKTPHPQADNRRVLRPYSDSMQRLLRDGYQPKLRPSQHAISAHFRRDNGGAIPPNILILPNTRSRDPYLDACRQARLPIHPARFPLELPQFFIRFLTEPGQLVLDPFAGSNVTGYAAELLGRRWISMEINAQYVAGSQFRFHQLRRAA